MKHFFLLLFLIINAYSIELQKAKIYDKEKHHIDNWLMSEKLDGIRAYWDGKELLSKNGNKIYAPTWFLHNLPPFELDGELWTKRDDFENIQNIVLDTNPSPKWEEVTYNIFEIPNTKGNFEERLKKLEQAALFIAYIRVGADVLNRSTNIPPEIVSIVQAIIILFIAAKAFMKSAKEKKIVEKSREVASEGGN